MHVIEGLRGRVHTIAVMVAVPVRVAHAQQILLSTLYSCCIKMHMPEAVQRHGTKYHVES